MKHLTIHDSAITCDETVTNCHHFYTEDDCHEGVMRGNVFTGEVGKYRWEATVTLGVPYCSSCDQPIPTHGYCAGCDIYHADVAEPLTETLGDPLLNARKAA